MEVSPPELVPQILRELEKICAKESGAQIFSKIEVTICRVSCSNLPLGDHPETSGEQLESRPGTWNQAPVRWPHHGHLWCQPELLVKLSGLGFSCLRLCQAVGHPENFSEVVLARSITFGPPRPAPSQPAVIGRHLHHRSSSSGRNDGISLQVPPNISTHTSRMEMTSVPRGRWRS